MAGLRKGHSYSRKVKRAYTRKSKFKKKGYVKGTPLPKIVKYDMGDLKKDFPKKIHLVSKQPVQVRHNAIESTRMFLNRRLHKDLGMNYRLKLRLYPHHVLRENKMLTGAGADRMQSGMQKAFGKPIGLAAQIKKGQKIFTVYIEEEHIETAKKILHSGIHRMPQKYVVVVE